MRISPRWGWFLAFTAVFAAGAGFVFWGCWSTAVTFIAPDDGINFRTSYGDILTGWWNGFLTTGRMQPTDVFWSGLLGSPLFCRELKYLSGTYFAALGMAYFLRGRGLSHLASYGAGLLLAFCGYWFTLFSAGHGGWFIWMTYGVFAFGLVDRAVALGNFRHWLLLGAMVAPTPTSALLHSATMVKAGVYLLLRLSPMMHGTYVGIMVSAIGGFTFFAASLLAITVSDGKKVLAYSTISNLGLITAAAGCGMPEAVWAGIMLLIFHAVTKSMMFMSVGAYENSTGSRDVEDMHGMIVRYPRLAFVMTIGIFGMAVVPMGMCVAKWAALKAFIDSGYVYLTLFLCFGSASTLFYWIKWLGKIFSVPKGSYKHEDTVHGSEWIAIWPLSLTAVILCLIYPVISALVVTPYTQNALHSQSEYNKFYLAAE